jgi:spermidine synthase
MTRALTRLLFVAFLGSALIPTVTEIASGYHATPLVLLERHGAVLIVALISIAAVRRLLPRLEPHLDSAGTEQAGFLDTMPVRYLDLAIAAAAGMSLLLELSVIRWQSSVFPFFAFYTNFGLLACFAGLGLGYALASRDRVPLILVLPLLAWQFLLLIGLRAFLQPWQYRVLGAIPVIEQANMGVSSIRNASHGIPIYFFLATVFLLTALTFIPVGQLCGRLMTRRPQLRAYGLNLVGSLAGVVAMFLASSGWTPPVVWFAVSFTVILMLTAWRPRLQATALLAAMSAVAILAWPVSGAWQRIYSPYQMLELGYGANGSMEIRAAGHYFQRVFDFSSPAALDDSAKRVVRAYYDLPYRLLAAAPADIAVVGAGAGNDVAAALRAGATHIDAIEIDPAILRIGGAGHPEHPYANQRVNAVLADARSFLRTTGRSYDLIVYGLLDSHTLLSQQSSVRLDSFVYTVEGFREARARLKPGGRIVLSFSIINAGLGRKMVEMMRQAFDGAEPVVISSIYDGATTFMQSREGNLVLPDDAVRSAGFEPMTRYSTATVRVDASTDDWPFFYMPRRVYPLSYLALPAMVLLVVLSLTTTLVRERPRASEASFFLLGAGFMLVETKAITELGLMFGSTWRVIGVAISGILLMAWLANAAVERFGVRRPQMAFVLLLLSLAGGWYVVGSGGLPSTPFGRVAAVTLLTMPMFFSGIVFSTLLSARAAIGRVMAANLVGAMCGGLLEYNSMYFGFRFLYVLAMAFYAVAFLVWLASRRAPAVASAPSAIPDPEPA